MVANDPTRLSVKQINKSILSIFYTQFLDDFGISILPHDETLSKPLEEVLFRERTDMSIFFSDSHYHRVPFEPESDVALEVICIESRVLECIAHPVLNLVFRVVEVQEDISSILFGNVFLILDVIIDLLFAVYLLVVDVLLVLSKLSLLLK